ncbi:hypothetical protein INH39_16605 [Massilia violaceinigra]|uniref:Uncharacterized protein n=1 Tax=Massilia violaceinigra TaxID=2045208 RepID=A0ABY4AGQ5_9BURK|nr:hypothetical protein [Massilia violaceinigra]UOD33114.1 hypothetical protein INH39_16605 [Massilia violaceinigra]
MTQNTLPNEDMRRISQTIGREVTLADMGNRQRFTDFTETDVQEFQRLAHANMSVLAIKFIRCRINSLVPLRDATDYYDRVIVNGPQRRTRDIINGF